GVAMTLLYSYHRFRKRRGQKYPDGICRHCRQHYINRPRNLCWSCYYRPGVRDQYPAAGDPKYTRQQTPEYNGASPEPEPTAALPGTAEKVEVLIVRMALGLSLFSVRDRQRDLR